MKDIFSTPVVILILLAPYISGVSIFTYDDGYIYCDGIVCPPNSISCTVSKNTFGNLTNYKYTRTCYDFNGHVTQNSEQILPNPNPATPLNMVSTVGSGGTFISSGDTLSQTQREALEETLRQQQNYWSTWSKDFSENLQKSFPKGFPFN